MIDVTRLQQVLEHKKLKVCLEDAKRLSYRQLEHCFHPRSWKELSKSWEKERQLKNAITTKGQASYWITPWLNNVREALTNRLGEMVKAVVIKKVAPRSNEVDLQRSGYKRNRSHLVTKESLPLQAEKRICLHLPKGSSRQREHILALILLKKLEPLQPLTSPVVLIRTVGLRLGLRPPNTIRETFLLPLVCSQFISNLKEWGCDNIDDRSTVTSYRGHIVLRALEK